MSISTHICVRKGVLRCARGSRPFPLELAYPAYPTASARSFATSSSREMAMKVYRRYRWPQTLTSNPYLKYLSASARSFATSSSREMAMNVYRRYRWPRRRTLSFLPVLATSPNVPENSQSYLRRRELFKGLAFRVQGSAFRV